jgi:hypothetical protein
MGVKMSKVSGTTIGGGLIGYDKRINRRYFSTATANVSKQRRSYSRIDRKNLPSFSLMPEACDAWNLLTSEIKNDWETAGAVCGLSGFSLFLQDKIYRIKNEIAGNETQNIYHQYKVVHLYIPEASGNVLIRQIISRTLTFPATLYLSRKAELISENGGSEFIKIRFRYFWDNLGTITEQTDELNLSLSTAWGNETLPITEQSNVTGHCELEIETDLIYGDLYYDNLYVSDINGIFSKDSNCQKSNKVYNNLIIPNGVINESIYPDD